MELTKITTGILLELKANSKNSIYSADPTVAHYEFYEKYPDANEQLPKRPDILTMRSIMAGDVVMVKDKLVLAKEVDLLDPVALEKKINAEIKKAKKAVVGVSDRVKKMIDEDVEMTKKYYKTRGYLAMNVRLHTNMGTRGKPVFDEIYHDIKERYPDKLSNGYIHRDKDDVWGVQLRISFKTNKSTADLLLIPGMSITKTPGGGDSLNESKIDDVSYTRADAFDISKNELVYSLLEEGFDLGKMQNVDEIRAKVPEEYREAFDEGYTPATFKGLFEEM